MKYTIVFLVFAMLLLGGVFTGTTIATNYSEDVTDGEYWGLLISVGVYADDSNQNRPLMLEEVDDFHSHLLTSPWWKEDHIKVIKGEEATLKNIIDGFSWLDSKETSNDISLVYITTHGYPLGFDIPPIDEADGTDEALISFWGFAYPTAVLWDDELNVLLNRLESHGVCLIVDSCYAGGFNDPPDWGKATWPFMIKSQAGQTTAWIDGFAKEVRGQGRVVIMASCEDEVSFSGGFAPYFIDGLRGYADTNNDGIISAEEAFYYTEPRTSRQHPTLYDGYDGELPILSYNSDSDTRETSDLTWLKTEMGDNTYPSEKQGPDETALLCGYITDAANGQAIENAFLNVIQGDYMDGFWNETVTDINGYYRMHVTPGNIMIFSQATGHLSQRLGPYTVGDDEILWCNISMDPHPEETAKIRGYITNVETGEPINDANIYIDWGNRMEGYSNETYSDGTGFYTINVAAGPVELSISKDGYIRRDTDDYTITDGETFWLNISLTPRPREEAMVCGYVIDADTGVPIDNAQVYLEWQNEYYNRMDNDTMTDSSGFYSMNVAGGETHLDIEKRGYQSCSTYRNDVRADGVLWLNISLEKELFQVDIQKPLHALYLNNNRILPYSNCIVLGAIDVEVFIHDFWYRSRNDDVERVEFYIDETLKKTTYEEPFSWTWNEKLTGIHNIHVCVYDTDGNMVEDAITVLRL
jgi:protocatechuate 3,4-dioxygenase beta subunit